VPTLIGTGVGALLELTRSFGQILFEWIETGFAPIGT
jgi:hypothetical protein